MRGQGRHAILALLLALGVAGCGRQQGPSPLGGASRVTLTGAGASFPYPLYSKWIAEYAKIAPEVRINYQSIGSGGGIQQLKAGTVDFGASDAPLSNEEMKAMPAPVVHLPATAGAVAVVYSLPKLSGELRFTGSVLAAVFLGEITRWNDERIAQLNPGVALPDLPIAVICRSDGSGTSQLFTSYLAAVSKPWSDRVGLGKSVKWPVGMGAKGNEGVAGMVKQTPGAIGYVELAYASQNTLFFGAIENAAGEFVTPSASSVAAAAGGGASAMQKDVRVSIVNSAVAGAYPISGFSYLLVYREQKDAAKAKALVGFLRWAMSHGQSYAERLDYAPLPAAVVALHEEAIQSIAAVPPALAQADR